MKQRGTVRWFSDEKGYGFIVPEDGGPEVFVHRTDLAQSCHVFGKGLMLYPDDVVTFDLVDSGNGKGSGKKAAKVEKG